MGGTKILSSLINSENGIIKSVKKPTKSNSTPKAYIKTLSEIINETIEVSNVNPGNIKSWRR